MTRVELHPKQRKLFLYFSFFYFHKREYVTVALVIRFPLIGSSTKLFCNREFRAALNDRQPRLPLSQIKLQSPTKPDAFNYSFFSRHTSAPWFK